MHEDKRLWLQQWALAAEIIGGLAVVVSLIFLILETRENTNAIQAQTYQDLSAELNNVRQQMTSEDITILLFKLRDDGLSSLTEVERYRIVTSIHGIWQVYESAYYAKQRNILGDEEWTRFEIGICRNLNSDFEVWAPPQGGIVSNITPAFREHVEYLCADIISANET